MKILSVDITEKEKNKLLEDFKNLDSGYICVTSVHGLIEAYENQEINSAFSNSYANVPDGMPIVYFARWFKKLKMNRITGPEFIYDVLNMLNNNNNSISTIGSDEKTIKQFNRFVNTTYKNIKINQHDTSFIDINSPEDIKNIIKFCADNNSDYFFIFLSTPKQDLLMYHINNALSSKLIGFGAAVDYLVGNTNYAPNIVKKLSLEWLYRLYQEPKRLYKRYINIVPKFFIYLLYSYFENLKKS